MCVGGWGVRDGGRVVGHCRQQSAKGSGINVLNKKLFSGVTKFYIIESNKRKVVT